MTDDHINIFASAEEDGYVADIPDLECCSAFGATPEEALAEVQQAKAAWIEAARSTGKPIPPPIIDQRFTRPFNATIHHAGDGRQCVGWRS